MVTLRALTYVAQGAIWRHVAVGAHPMSRTTAFKLSLAKLFADQALPSGGLSSSIVLTRVLEQSREDR